MLLVVPYSTSFGRSLEVSGVVQSVLFRPLGRCLLQIYLELLHGLDRREDVVPGDWRLVAQSKRVGGSDDVLDLATIQLLLCQLVEGPVGREQLGGVA